MKLQSSLLKESVMTIENKILLANSAIWTIIGTLHYLAGL